MQFLLLELCQSVAGDDKEERGDDEEEEEEKEGRHLVVSSRQSRHTHTYLYISSESNPTARFGLLCVLIDN